MVKSELANGLRHDFYDIKPDDNLPRILADEKSGYTVGAVIKEILYMKTTDALLWGICLKYHEKLYATGKISNGLSSGLDYKTVTVNNIGEHKFKWEIAGKKIEIKQRQLKKMIYDFKLKEIEKVIRREMISENTAEALEKVFADNYFNSLRFIQRLFELEETVFLARL